MSADPSRYIRDLEPGQRVLIKMGSLFAGRPRERPGGGVGNSTGATDYSTSRG
jgi:hypothetical protein